MKQLVNAGRKAKTSLIVAAVSGAALLAPVCTMTAHATGTPATPYAGDVNAGSGYGYVTGDGNTDAGSTNAPVSGGNTVDQTSVRTDYGQIGNIFLARFTPVLVVCGIAGAVMFAAGGGVRMIHGYLRGGFH